MTRCCASARQHEQSLDGLDSECDVFIDAARPGNAMPSPRSAPCIRLLAEHCGLAADRVAAALAAAGGWLRLRLSGAAAGGTWRRFASRSLTQTEETGPTQKRSILSGRGNARVYQRGRRGAVAGASWPRRNCARSAEAP
jgi:hypothetical protein